MIFDFTQCYPKRKEPGLEWHDCSAIGGSRLYCSRDAEEKIKALIAPAGVSGIHFIDSGDYHYISKIMTDFIKEPFTLVLIDHHTDMQDASLGGDILSCGNWAKKVLQKNPYLQKLVLIGQEKKVLDKLQSGARQQETDGKLVEISYEELKNGKAHELSEGDTLYLGAAPKAATSKDRRKQPFSDELAKPRAFAFKNSYMTYVLNNYIIPGKNTYEPIVKDIAEDSFEDYVVRKINAYCDWSVTDLCTEFHVEYQKKPKNLEAMLAYRMLGIKGNHAEEFEKANVVVKTIRIAKNNKIKENMSFPTFKFKELIDEDWDNSTFGNYLRETRFLFVVYKYDKQGELRLKGCQFWNIPYEDLEENVKTVWERTQTVIREGLKTERRNGKNYNNLPKASENPVCHVRPHAQNSKDTYELPDGRLYPKQCFWLNNNYILSQLDKRYFQDL